MEELMRDVTMAEQDWRFFIGNQTAFSAPVSDPFAFAVEHRFDAFEFFPDGGPAGRGWSAEDITGDQRASFRAAATERKMRLSVHAALESQLLDRGTWGSLMRDIALARDLGAAIVNLHLGAGDPKGCSAAALALVEVLQPLGITLALENTVSVGPDEVNEIFDRIAGSLSVHPGAVGLCLDIGHANLFSPTHNDYLRFIDGLGAHVPIVHAHIHENWGDGDNHLTLFTGPSAHDASGVVGLMRRLRHRHFKGSLIMEQWPMPASLLLTAHERLRAIP
jgi:sugar phosphate isomerase/epimerase